MLSMVSKTPSAGKTSMMSGFRIRKFLFLLAVFLFASVANAATFTISTPTADGTFTLSWSGARTYVELYEKVNGINQKIGDKYNISGTLDITKPPGTYTFVLGDILVYGNQSGGPYTTGTLIEKSVTVSAPTVPPVTPASITVNPDHFLDKIDISWPVTNGAMSYELQRNGTTIYSGSATSHQPSSLVANTSYTFQVRACNSYGCSGWRAAAAVSLQETFGVPTTSTTGQYNINIMTPSSATHTRIEESGSASGPWNTIATITGNQSYPLTRINGTFYYRLLYCVFTTQSSNCTLRNQIKSIVVSQPKPSISASFSPATINEGGSATLNWNSSNASSCSASGIGGVSSPSGSTTYTASNVMSANAAVNVTVTCVGGGGNNSAVASLNVNWVNDSPTVSGIASRNINEDASTGAIGFTVGDEETAVTSLVVTATSSNTTLIPNGNIQLGGSGSSRTITVTPVANLSGSTEITVAVKDANNAQAIRKFTVNVAAVDDAPVISDIAGMTINEGAISAQVSFTVTDIDTTSGLQVNASSNRDVIPNENISLTGSGSSRQISVKANKITFANAPYEDVTITVSVSGGSPLPVAKTFSVRVNNVAGRLTLPATNSSGSYSVGWDFATHGVRIYEDGKLIVGTFETPGPQSGSKSITKTVNGKYTYVLEDCSVVGSGTTTSWVCNQTDTRSVQVTLPPPAPAVTIKEINKMGTYDVSWTSVPEVTRYVLRENGTVVPDNGAPLVRLKQFLLKPNGTYSYTVQSCINTLCGPQSAARVIVVNSGILNSSGSSSSSGTIDDGKYVNSPLPTGPMSQIPVGAIAGSFRVDESGAANYQIPIASAAGTAGVAPQFSAGYNSQGGNGILGKGWGINGMSEISRCRQTLVQDKNQLPITWTEEDRFCLNGQRLVVVEGTYGWPGSIYKTEIDSYITVTAHGGSDGNPDYFSMNAKDGSRTVFGGLGQHNAEVSARDSAGNIVTNKILTWSISQFKDNVGNPINYRYNNTSEYFNLKEVLFAYGTDKSVESYGAKISFGYEDRDDPMGGYLSGYYFKNTQRLDKIESYSGTNLLRRYNFNYDEQSADQISGMSSRLTSVEECVDSGCLPKTTFNWATQTASLGPKGGSLTQINKIIYTYEFLDINGNGKQDLVWMEKTDGTAVNIYARMDNVTGSGNTNATLVDYIDIHEEDYATLHVVDYNLDGRQDMFSYNPKFKQWAFYLATPSSGGNWSLVKTSLSVPFSGKVASFGDVNGDGLTDALSITSNNQLSVYLMERNPSATSSSRLFYRFKPTPLIYSLENPNALGFELDKDKIVRLSDFNGDGQADLMTWRTESSCTGRGCFSDVGKFDVYLKEGDSYRLFATFNSSTNLFKSVQAIDINSDGLMDLAVLRTDDWDYALNNGQGFDGFKRVHNSSKYGSYNLKDRGAAFADINRDGFTDVLWSEKVSSTTKSIKVKYWLPLENGFSANYTYSSIVVGGDVLYSYTDVDGDGWIDVVGFSTDKEDYTRLSVRGLLSAKTDMVEEIDNGIGRKTRITYESLSQSKHYARLAGIGSGSGNTYCQGGTTVPYTGETIGQICFDRDIYASSQNAFYEKINAPFANAENAVLPTGAPPVQELTGAIYVVTKAEASAPTASNPTHMNGMVYFYQSARLQGGGRGMLGFEKLRQVDLQTRISTVTTYRQDWPFIGQPVRSISYKGDVVELTPSVSPESAGVLMQASNTVAVKDFDESVVDSIEEGGTAALAGIQVYRPSSSQSTYSYHSDGSVTAVSHTNTDTHIDAWGNVTFVDVATFDGGTEISRLITNNTYGNGFGDYNDVMGRLTRTEVETSDAQGNTSTRVSAFEYCKGSDWVCPEGLLWKEIIEPDDNVYRLTTTYSYDGFGNKVSAVQSNASGAVRYSSTHHYDGSGRFVNKTVNVVGQENVTVVSRDRFGSATELKDINGVSIHVLYDSLGREYLRTDATGAWSYNSKAFCSQLGICPAGAVFVDVKLVSGGGRSFEFVDMLGRVIRTSTVGFDGTLINVDTEYDMMSKIVRQSNPYADGSTPNGWTVNQYDRMQRLKTVTLPDNTLGASMQYQGLLTTTTNALGKQKIEQHNALGQLVAVWDNTQGDTSQGIQYQYDLYGKLTRAISPGNVAVTMCYDKLGRKFAMHDPDKGGFKGNGNAPCPADGKVPSTRLPGWWYYEYNSFGELEKQYSPRQQVVTMTYDSLRRITTRIEPEGGTRWYYDNSTSVTDSIGKLMYVISSPSGIPGTNASTACSGSNHCTQYTYDDLGRLTHTTLYLPNDTRAYISSIDYDTIGRVYRESDVMGVGSGIRHHFNAYGYGFQTTDLATGDVLHKVVSKNLRGQVTEEWRFNGGAGITTYEYDELLGNLRVQQTGIGNLFGIQDIEYDWDAVGNLKYRNNIKQGKQESFCYDALNRLIKTYNYLSGACSPVMSNADVTYTAGGNITTKNGITYSYAGGTQAGPHAVTATTDGISYQYDANGNLLSDTSGRSITYSSYDQPLRIAKGSNAIEFSYNASRARWRRIDIQGSTRITTTYLGNVERIHQEGSTTIEWKRYIAGAIYTFKTNLDHVVQGSVNKRFTFTDHLGSLDTVTDTAGNVTDRLSFDPWGQRRNATTWSALSASDLANFKLTLTGFTQTLTTRGYTGHEMLDSMGLVHMNGRIYDPKLARFLQADPHIDGVTNTQGYNRYSYVQNNPLNATDPSGYWVNIVIAVVAYAVGDYARRNDIPWLAQVASIVGCVYGNSAQCAAASFGSTYGATKNLGLAVISGVTAGALGNLGPVQAFFVGGMIGGISSIIAGGDFWTGYLSGGLGAAAGARWGYSAEGMIASMIIGGTVSELTGDKFINGAGTAAFTYAMSWAASSFADGAPVEENHGECTVCTNASSTEAAGASWGLKKPNDAWKDKITVTELPDGTVLIKGKLTVSGRGAKQIAADVNAVYNGVEGEYDGVRYRVEIEMTVVSKNGDYQSRPLNNSEKKMFDKQICNGGWRVVGAWNGRGESIVAWNTSLEKMGWNVTYYPAHEFGHALGLNHAPLGSGSVLSYDFNKGGNVSLVGRNMADLANGYRK